MEAKPVPSLVLVHKVDLVQRGAEAHTGSVVKYSRSQHALAEADDIQMATAQYYRDYEGNAKGVRDETKPRIRSRSEAIFQSGIRKHWHCWSPGREPSRSTRNPSRWRSRSEAPSLTRSTGNGFSALHPVLGPTPNRFVCVRSSRQTAPLGLATLGSSPVSSAAPSHSCRRDHPWCSMSGSIGSKTPICERSLHSSASCVCSTVRLCTPTTPRACSSPFRCFSAQP